MKCNTKRPSGFRKREMPAFLFLAPARFDPNHPSSVGRSDKKNLLTCAETTERALCSFLDFPFILLLHFCFRFLLRNEILGLSEFDLIALAEELILHRYTYLPISPFPVDVGFIAVSKCLALKSLTCFSGANLDTTEDRC